MAPTSSPPGIGDARFEAFSRQLRRVDSYEELIELIRQDVQARFGLTNAWLYVVEQEDDDQLLLVATAGPKAALIRELVPVVPRAGDVMTDALLRDQRPIFIADAQLGPYPEVTRRLGNRTVINLPMGVVDHALGVLGCGTFDAEGVIRLIPKPLDPEALLRTVREVLDAAPTGSTEPPADASGGAG